MCRGWQRLFEKISDNIREGKTAWFHASSLGEFEQARPVLEQFKSEHPEYRICLTFFSPSGFEVRKNHELADIICYLPLDTRRNAREFVQLINPDVAFFVKYDHWFNLLNELRIHKIPTFLFSAIFRPSQYFFKPYGRWFLKELNCYTHIFVQNDESVMLLKQHGIEQVSKTGDTRFDRVNQIAQQVQHFPAVEQFIKSGTEKTHVILAGSSWDPDEAMLKQYMDKHADNIRMIIAPHEIHESRLTAIETLFAHHGTIRLSLLNTSEKTDYTHDKVLIIDNYGMLSSLYQYADIAYIGGGFGKGIHNTLEAMTFGKPVVFGPNYKKFKEAHDIIAKGGGKSYETLIELNNILNGWLNDEANRQKACLACRQYVEDNLGSASHILQLSNTFLT